MSTKIINNIFAVQQMSGILVIIYWNMTNRVTFISLALFLLALFSPYSPAYAVRAFPGAVTVTQADGTTLTIRIHGDENFHYTTTSDGYLITQRDGIYYYATVGADKIENSGVRVGQPCAVRTRSVPVSLVLKARQSRAIKQHGKMMARIGLDTGFPTTGNIRSLVILAGFSDKNFSSSSAQADFDRLLNQEGYSENGATGSARDYYIQNSGGRFIPQFDVVGPVVLPNTVGYYGENGNYGLDTRAEEMIIDACRLADEQYGVNFADYDLNNDGLVDNVFVFYAGVNEAEGGGDNTIWPHRSELTEVLVLDGKTVSVYACTSEINMAGWSPQMAGIGTFCHEFGHVLGWPDFYDTDGSENGETEGVWDWSLMCTGSYNNEGRTPPSLSAVERMLVGWCEPEELVYTGNYTLQDIQSSNKAYFIPTDTDGEYFILENRQNTSGWDMYLGGHGLLIWHVDRSGRYVAGQGALDRWLFNSPNNVKSHQCCRIITARPGSTDGYQPYMPFPGQSGKTEFSSVSNPENVSWSGAHIDAELTNIREEDGVITFRAETSAPERYPVTGVHIEGRGSVVVNDTVQLKAVLVPANADNRNVFWTSSDTAVIRIDEGGVAKAVRTGEATITVTTEDGGFTDTHVLKVENRQIFRAKVINSSRQPLAEARLDIPAEDGSCSAVADINGIVYMEGISKGSHIAVLTHPDYPEQRKALSIIEGASVCELVMYTEEEMESGVAPFNVNVAEYETSAYISWPGSDASAWRVEWYETESPETWKAAELEVKKLDIAGLERNTSYTVKVSEMDGVAEGSFRSVTFTTLERTSIYPVILLHSLYEKGETLLLKAANLPDGAVVGWFVDGVPVETVEFVAEAPEHEIKLTIDDGNRIETIVKYIRTVE